MSTLCNHGARLVLTLVRGKVRWDRNNGKSWSNSSWFFAVVSYLGTAVKRRTPECPLHHIRMQEDRIQKMAELMDDLPSDITEQGTALDLSRHLLKR